jgi:uncharacterized protein YbjT (DUF2867 family)
MEATRSSKPNREEHVMQVLVIGATGNVGSYLTKRLREDRVPVRALVRSSDKALTLFPDADDAARPLEIVSGAFDDPAVLDRAFDGVDAAFLALGTSPRQVMLEKGLIDAAARAHLKQLVRQSVLRQNVQAAYEIARLHGELDAYVAASGVPHTDLRPAYFTSNLLAAAPSIASSDRWYGTAPTGRIAMCDPRDVSDAAAIVLQKPSAQNTAYDLTGPAALTFPEVAAHFTEILGRPISYVPVDEATLRNGYATRGMPDWLSDIVLGLDAAMQAGDHARTTDAFQKLTGKSPRSVDDFIRDHATAYARR